MSKYRKIFHHVSSKDVRKKHQDGITQLRIKEEKKIKLLDYTSSAMKMVKYDWRSDGDLSAELREAMTTANVYQKLGTHDDGEIEDQIIDTSLEASFEDGPDNGLENMMFKAVTIKDGGTGTGDNGGFDIGKHLAFSHNANSDGSNYVDTSSRHALLAPIDARNTDTITITAIRGNDSNGGELPDWTGEELRLMWFNKDSRGGIGDWMDIDFEDTDTRHNDISPTIIPIVSGDSGSYDGSFPGLRDWTITIPDWCKNENQRFGLWQLSHSGRQYDHYGITKITYRARTPSNAFVALDKPEASSFVRFGTSEGDPKKRKKKLEDQLKASKEYTDTVLGTDFPGGSATLSEPTPSPIGYDNLSKTHIQAGTLSQQLKRALGKETSTEKTASTTLDKIKQLTKDPIDPKLIVPDKPVSTPSELGIDEGTPVAEVIKKISNKPGAEKVPEIQTIQKSFPDYKPNKDAPPGWKLGSVDGIEPWPEDPRLEGTEWDPNSSNYKTLERRTLEKKVPSLDKVEEYFPEYKNDDAPPGWKLGKDGNLEPWLEDQRLVGTEWDPRAYLNSELVPKTLPDNVIKELDKIDQGQGWGKKILDMTEKVIKSTLEKELETNKWEEQFTRKVTTAGQVYLRYLTNTLPEKISNETLGQDYIEDSFEKAHFNNRGTVTLGEYVIGSGQVPTYDSETGLVSLKFNYDFDTNTQAIMKEPDKYDPTKLWKAVAMTGAWIAGGKYGIDSIPVPLAGYATWLAKLMGSATHTPGEITIPLEWLQKNNNPFYLELYNRGILDDKPVDDDPEKEPVDDPEKEPIDEPSDPIPLPPKFPPGWTDDVHTQIQKHGWDVGANFGSFGELSVGSGTGFYNADSKWQRKSTVGNYKSAQDVIGQAPIEGKVDWNGDVTRYWPIEALMNDWQESDHAWSRPWIDYVGKGERPEDKVVSMQERHAIIGSLPDPISLRGAASSYSFSDFEKEYVVNRRLKSTNDKIEKTFKNIDKLGARGDYSHYDRNTRKSVYTPWSEQKIAEQKYSYISSAYVDQAVRINQNKYWMDDLAAVYPSGGSLGTLGNFMRSVNAGGSDQDLRYKLAHDPAYYRPMDSYNVHEIAYGRKYSYVDGERKLSTYGKYHEKALARAYSDSGLSGGKWTGADMKWDNEIAKTHYKLVQKANPRWYGKDQNGKTIRGWNWELDPEYQYHSDIKRAIDNVNSNIQLQRIMLGVLSTQMSSLAGQMGYDPKNFQTDPRAVERVKQNDNKSNQSTLPGWLKDMLNPGVANLKSSPSVEKKDTEETPPKPDEPLPPGKKWELIPARYGGIVDGQWDPDYMHSPPAWTQVNIEDPDVDQSDESDEVTSEDEKWLDTKQTLVNLTKVLTHIGLPNDFGQWSINYAKGDMTPITKFSAGMRREVESMVLKKFKENPNAKTVSIQYSDYGWKFKNMSTRLGLGRFNATRLSNGEVRINDTFNVDQTFKTVGSFDIIPTLQDTANRIVDIAHKRRNINTYDEGGIPVEVTLDMKSKLKRLDLSVDDPIVRDSTPKRKRKKSNYTPSKISESKKENSFDKIKKVSKSFNYPGKPTPSPDGFPDDPPPELDPKTGMHPRYGKNAARYKKLDPISANSMPKTGDPEIDAVVAKQKKEKKTRSNWREELESII